MAVVSGRFEQLRADELLERRAAEVVERLRLADGTDQRGGQRQPAEGHSRSERLGDGAKIDYAIGRETLQRAERRAVVAELGVVVVLDDETSLACPAHDRAAPLGPRRDAR